MIALMSFAPSNGIPFGQIFRANQPVTLFKPGDRATPPRPRPMPHFVVTVLLHSMHVLVRFRARFKAIQ